MRLLVAEDEKDMNRLITRALEKEGYGVDSCFDGEEAMDYLESAEYDGVILDIMMPKMDGHQVLKKLRARGSDLPVLFLTARDSIADRVAGLDLGADDYVTKPFSPSELVARVDAIYRRVCMSENTAHMPKVIESGCFRLDQKSRTVSKNGEVIDLTQVEYQIMELFLKNQNVALDRNQILTEIWGDNYYGDIKIVDVNIRRLRMKVEEEPSNPKYIYTVWGYGYKWCGAAE